MLLSEYCPAQPTFQRMESDNGYFIGSTLAMNYQEAVDYCRTNFNSLTSFPDVRTLDYVTEIVGALFLKGTCHS